VLSSRRYSRLPRRTIRVYSRTSKWFVRKWSLRPRSIDRLDSFPLPLLSRFLPHHVCSLLPLHSSFGYTWLTDRAFVQLLEYRHEPWSNSLLQIPHLPFPRSLHCRKSISTRRCHLPTFCRRSRYRFLCQRSMDVSNSSLFSQRVLESAKNWQTRSIPFFRCNMGYFIRTSSLPRFWFYVVHWIVRHFHVVELARFL